MITITILLRLHEYCMFMPKAVFEGFTVSVALTIGLGQTDFAFGYVQKLWKEQKWHFGLLSVVALMCWIVDSVTGLVVGTMVALLVTGKETARGHAEVSITAAGNKRLVDGSPEMISIDALAVDNVDL